MGQLVPKKENPFGVPAVIEQPAGLDSDVFSLRRYLEILQRRWRWVAGMLALVVAGTALQVATITPLYRSTATIQVDPNPANVLPFQDLGQARRGRSQDEALQTEITKLRSSALAEKVVERLDLADNEAFIAPIKSGILREGGESALAVAKRLVRGDSIRARGSKPGQRALINRVRQYSSVQPVRRTWLINIHFDSPDRDAAQLVANGLAQLFVDEQLEASFSRIGQATEFLQKQLEDLKIDFEASERRLYEYASENNLENLGGERSSSQQQLNDLSQAITRADDDIAAQAAKYDTIRRSSVENLPDSILDSSILAMLSQRRELENKLAELRARFGPAWPEVQDTRDKLAELDLQLAAEKDRAADRALRELQLLRSRRGRLQAERNSVRSSVGENRAETAEYDLLKQEAETSKQLYESVLTRLKEAGVAAGIQVQNIAVTQPALRPVSPYTPNKTQALFLALLLGASLGVVVAFVVELIDNSLKSADDVTKYLNLPSLGVIPRLDPPARGLRARLRRHRAEGHQILLSDAETTRESARAREAYRALRTSILLSHSGKPPQTILITSAAPSEGKSTTAANIAIALAQAGNRTLLVDMDLRRPRLGALLDIEDEVGLSGFLAGTSDLSSLIVTTEVSNLFFVGAGQTPPNPPELLGSERMDRGINLMREYFTHVVIDSPPALELSDPLVISQHADGVILVARSGRTPRALVGRTANLLQSVGASILGVVLNGVESSRFRYGYYSKYGYYDSYNTSPAGNR